MLGHSAGDDGLTVAAVSLPLRRSGYHPKNRRHGRQKVTEMAEIRFRPMPLLHEDMSGDTGGDTSPDGFGHTVIAAAMPASRPRAPAAPAVDSDTRVVDVDDGPLMARSISVILRHFAPSPQAYADQCTVLQAIRRCAGEVAQDCLAIEALGELANPDDIDARGQFLRTFDEASLGEPIRDMEGNITTWELLALDAVVSTIVVLDRFGFVTTEDS